MATSLPPPPVPSDEAMIEIEALDAGDMHLILWLDEQERYFEGVECWLALKSAVGCEFE